MNVMLMNRMNCVATAIALVLTLANTAWAADPLAGTKWKTEDGTAIIAFGPCKSGVCGIIESSTEAQDAKGQPYTDVNNPNPAKRKKPIIGLATIYDVKPTADNVYAANSYDPRNGQEHEITLTRSANALILKGCGLGGLICQSFTWTAVE
jgi:uncharacterized protein (DUF2147 family)